MTSRLGFTILCVGDDPINLNLRCARLRDLGWDVVSSGNAHEAILALGRQRVDAAVLDLNAQGAENALIAGQIRKEKPNIPIIILVQDVKALVPGATNEADAVVLKTEEDPILHRCLRELLLRV